MLTLEVNNKQGVFQLNLPTSLNEIDESYIMEVTNHVKVDNVDSVNSVIRFFSWNLRLGKYSL